MIYDINTIFDYFERNGYSNLPTERVEVTEEVYDYFLNILPLIYVPGGFLVPEAVTGNVYSGYYREGGRYYHRYTTR